VSSTPLVKLPGEGILLDWGWDDATEWHVRGHVADDVAEAWALDAIEEDGADPPSHFVVRHQWARWSCEATPDGPGRVLRTYWSSGRGRFPLTTAFDGDEWARLAQLRARRAAEIARAEETMAALWPEATIEAVYVQKEGLPTLVDLRFPWSRHGPDYVRESTAIVGSAPCCESCGARGEQ